MTFCIRALPFKPPRLLGLSEKLMASHYENNYGGALRRLNAIAKRLAGLDWNAAPGFEINGLKREELIAANSVLLHEVYFDSLGGADGLGGAAGEPDADLAAAISRDFGSLTQWKAEFVAMGKALGGGSGWVILSWSPRLQRLVNQWASDHAHSLADGVPVLALDMYEHAYHLDFGANAAGYVEAFTANIHWARPAQRYRQAIGQAAAATAAGHSVSPEDLQAMLQTGKDVVVLDICLADDMAKRHDMMPGALIRAPETLPEWIDALPRDKPLVAYCMYGFQVSGNAVAEMRKRGLDARSLAGGIAAWHAIGGKTVPLQR
ncbi:Fe-Mn family superoxide dismutase [Ferrovibrio terrae]|uniref:Fe-Mn family superoxide dismutase n=1 Tax=Ferrovibrio terrae TaxID=2594003 RepID=UPI003137749D